jgi:hypothetical protein
MRYQEKEKEKADRRLKYSGNERKGLYETRVKEKERRKGEKDSKKKRMEEREKFQKGY